MSDIIAFYLFPDNLLYQFSLLVNQISDIVELFNCGVRKKGNSMAFFPLLSIRLLCSGNWY
ncbi:hypothetical protein CLD06_02260 [Wolbachia endosymbiont of Drosophila subpulchrella]|nr:hypothetical protein CLD06_02260 [Wolbachia endosymbiont of Drosophila subpulchrella]